MGIGCRRQGSFPKQGAGSVTPGAQGSLVVSATVLSASGFAGDVAFVGEDTFTVSNGGPGSLAGTQFAVSYAGTTGWLSLAFASVDGEVTVTPSFDASGVSASTQTATITITDGNASNSGLTVTVTFVVAAASPTIDVQPQSVAVQLADETVGTPFAIVVSNSGLGTLAVPTVGAITYGAGTASGWLGTPVVTGSSPGPYTITFTPTTVGGTVGGPYTASVPIVSAGATNTPFAFPVTLTIPSAQTAVLAVSRVGGDGTTTVGGASPADITTGLINLGPSGSQLAGPRVQSTTYSGDFSGWLTTTISGNTATGVFDTSGIVANGTARATVTFADSNSATTAQFTAALRVGAGTSIPTLACTPSIVATQIYNGTALGDQTLTVSNTGGGSLGTITAALTNAYTWVNASYAGNSSGGTVTLTFSTAALANGTYSATLRVTASGATNSPVDVPITITVVAAPTPGTFPVGPSLATIPNGYVWNDALGYPEGSIFNTLSSYRALDDNAMPTFSGTERTVTTQGTADADFAAALAASVDGDIITVTAGIELTAPVIPKRTGWTYGSSGMVWIRSSAHASLPAYVAPNTPDDVGAAHCVDRTANAAHMFRCTQFDINTSALHFQQGSGGWWITGCDIHNAVPYYTGTSQLLDLGARSNRAQGVQTQNAHCPSQLVFDRCIMTSVPGDPNPTTGKLPGFGLDVINTNNLVRGNARSVLFVHCDLGMAFCDYGSGLENKAFSIGNTPGPFAVIGCKTFGYGITILTGGLGNPTIAGVHPSDILFMWNKCHGLPTTYLSSDNSIGSNSKNAYESKDGIRVLVAFNDWRYLDWQSSQLYAFVVKCNSQSAGVHPSRVEDITIWCNRVRDSCKGILQLTDVNSGSGPGGAIGTERPEVRYNLVVPDWTRVHPGYASNGQVPVGFRRSMTITGSQGDGVPVALIDHNTFGGQTAFQYGSYDPSETAWTNLRVTNNVMHEVPQNGTIFGVGPGCTPTPCTPPYTALSDSPALERQYKPGNWTYRWNVVPNGSASWDAVLSNAINQNKEMASALASVNFADAANLNFTLTAASGVQASGENGTDPGYDHAYMTAMLPSW